MTRVLRYFHQDPIKTASLSSTSTTTTIVNLDSKQDKIKGKSLSTNDFTDIYKQKLKDIEDKAEVNVQADWNTTDTEDDSYIKNKPSSLPASDVYDWAKQETKPSYNLDEVLDGSLRKLSDYIPVSLKGIYGGVATLGANDGKVPESQLPSYVDDVLEFSDSSYFPQTGESGKIYVDIQTNLTYRWTGTQYTEISPSIALGETSSTAYAGDKGAALKTAFENHAADTTIHITAAERAVWNAKQDAISDLETIRSNASTAYGWGDHSLAGYLTSVDIADMATKTWVGLQGYTTNTGTVTSVAMTVPTGLSVSGSPITTNGTLAVTFASGYSIPTTTKLSNWDTAYGWGDHSLAGYQMAISDLATIRSRADEGHTAYGWGDHSQQGYVKSSGVTSVAMTVPTGLSISGSPITSTGALALSFASGYSIPTDAKQSNWDTAYSWGNHANEGYLKSITSQMVTNALGYTPPTQDTNTWRPITDAYTGSDTGTSVSLKGTNDLYNALVNGYASSAGNADTVDNLHATDFVMAYGTTNNNIDSDWGQSIKTFDPIPSGTPPEQCPNISLLSLGDNFARRKLLAFMYDTDNIYYRRNNSLTFSPWVKLLHTGNYADYALPLIGGTLTGNLNLAGSDLCLGTLNSSSDDSGDIVFYYGNGAEKSRIWTPNVYTNGIGPWYRAYGFDGTLLYDGRLATIGDLENYLPLGGGTLTGNLYIGNSTFYANGTNGGVNSLALADDAILGDCNIGGHLGLKSLNTSNAGISFYASDGTAIGRFTASSSGVPLWSDNTMWHGGNDGSGSGLDADMLDGYHENSFLRFRGATETNGEGSLWSQIGIKEYHNVLPDGLSRIYPYGSVISIPGTYSRFDIYASYIGSDLISDYNSSGIYVRTGWHDDRKRWRRLAYADEIAATSGIRDYTQGTLIRTYINYNVTNGDAFYMEITGECYALGFVKTLVRGYIYYDTIINYGVENLGTLQITELYAMNLDGTLCFWFPRLGYWHSFDVKVYKSSTGNYYYSYVSGVLDSAKPTGTKEVLLTNDTYNVAFTTSNVASATQLQTTRYFWGHAFNGTADVTGAISLADSIEFTGVGSSAGNGGFIDFHYNGSSADYTSRIIEDLQGRISVNNSRFYNNAITSERVLAGLFGPIVVGNPNDAWSDGIWSHPWYSYDASHDLTSTQTSDIYSYLNEVSYHTTISDYFGMVLRSSVGLIRLRFDGTFFIENTQYTNKIEFYHNNVESVLAFIDRSGGTYFGLRYGNGSTTSEDYLNVGDQGRNTYLRGRDVYIYPDTAGVVGFFSGNEGYNGVGTSSPSYKLQVDGACAASSFPNTSDLRLKRVYADWYPTIELIAEAPIFTFKWKDNTFDDDIHIGSSALYWQDVAPELVTTAKDDIGTLSLQYDVLGLASSVTVAKEVIKLQRELEDTKEELELLRAQIAELKLLLK